MYAPAICGPALFRLKASLANGSPLFLLGECEGVGLSCFLSDVATAFNLGCERAGDPRRVLHVPLLPGCRSVRHFFDAVATMLQADYTLSELKTRSPVWLGEKLYALLCQARVAMIVIDHVHLLPSAVRDV